MPDNRRDYGLASAGEPIAPPEWAVPLVPETCPYCKGDLVHVRVLAKLPDLVGGGEGYIYYLGCPACPYASPAVSPRSGGDMAVVMEKEWATHIGRKGREG